MIKKTASLLILSVFWLSACTTPPALEGIVPDEAEPLHNSLSRVTKKPFGIRISPDDSPVTPERFAGYHTGADFEILPGEEEVEVDVFAICTGPLVEKRQATGYGGMMVQQCVLEGEAVTVIYGHLNLKRIAGEVNDTLMKGQKAAILGQGYSNETDGERKHLHLGIHKGREINILGYVQSEELLENWIDPLKFLK